MSIKKYLSKIEDFQDKKIIITGATAGIGLCLAKQLVSKNASLVILARNLSKANKVRDELLAINQNAKIDIIQYDQSDYDSIDAAVKEINEKHADFDALVANAGIMCPNKGEISKQGYPLTIDTNYLGLKRFLDEIIPTYKNKRYLLQGSVVAGFRVSPKEDIYSDKRGLRTQYHISKACVEALWHHYYVSNKENEFILTEPGVTSSDIFRNFNWLFRTVGKFLVKVFCHPTNKAALTLLKGLTKYSKNGDYIVPRGLFTISGYPKYKKFPKKRIRDFLINKVRN